MFHYRILGALLLGAALGHSAVAADEVTQQQARQTVQSYFDALEKEDWAAMNRLTTGDAQKATDELINTIITKKEKKDVSIDIKVAELRIAPAAGSGLPGRLMQADYLVKVYAKKLFFSVLARKINGTSRFRVQMVEGEPRITDIRGELEMTQ